MMWFPVHRRRLAKWARWAGVRRASAILFALTLAPGLQANGATPAQPRDANAQAAKGASSARPDGAPAPLAGLWRHTMTQTGVENALPKVVFSMCVGGSADASTTLSNAPKGDQDAARKLCASSSWRDAEGYLVTQDVCPLPQAGASASMTLATTYLSPRHNHTHQFISGVSSAYNAVAKGEADLDSVYLGACPTGMKPGQMLTSGGHIADRFSLLSVEAEELRVKQAAAAAP